MVSAFAIALALAQSAPAADRRPIIVTGTPLPVTARNLDDCLRQRCPPDKDINASIAHAEEVVRRRRL